jgi:outer membrane protein insertion porin family
VNVTMRMQEGEQYFVNRLTFVGNTTTRDNVIRREVRLYEGAPFNTELLKYSVKRLNQLGYFKPLEEGQGIDVQKTPNSKNEVDVTLKLEEQNRNQLTFGAGVSQFEGFFGQLSFQTSNFMGRGEALTVSLQVGSRSENYQIAFSEPFLFDRNITGGIDVYKRTLRYIDQFTQEATGGNITGGFPLAGFSRMFVQYSYEAVNVSDLNPVYYAPELIQRNPYLRDSLLLGEGGQRTISKVTPSFVHNTVDNPIFPNTGMRLTGSVDFAGLGGNTNFIKPRFEYAHFLRHTNRTSIGFRTQVEYIRPYGTTTALPITENLYLGGEYTIRGFDIRSIGPRDPETGYLVLGGNKTFLINAEYLISIAGPVRLVLFYDTGQVRDLGQRFAWKEDVTETVDPALPAILDPFTFTRLTDPNAPPKFQRVIGQTSAFKTSTGAEVRFFMPVLNVPFRLIFAYNPQRFGILDNNLSPAKRFTFKFAVGSTF